MKQIFYSGIVVLAVVAGSVSAQDRSTEEAMRIATESGICGDAGVNDANFNAEDVVEVVCNEDATAFFPLAGALGPALAGGFGIILLAASGGGDAASDTQ